MRRKNNTREKPCPTGIFGLHPHILFIPIIHEVEHNGKAGSPRKGKNHIAAKLTARNDKIFSENVHPENKSWQGAATA